MQEIEENKKCTSQIIPNCQYVRGIQLPTHQYTIRGVLRPFATAPKQPYNMLISRFSVESCWSIEKELQEYCARKKTTCAESHVAMRRPRVVERQKLFVLSNEDAIPEMRSLYHNPTLPLFLMYCDQSIGDVHIIMSTTMYSNRTNKVLHLLN